MSWFFSYNIFSSGGGVSLLLPISLEVFVGWGFFPGLSIFPSVFSWELHGLGVLSLICVARRFCGTLLSPFAWDWIVWLNYGRAMYFYLPRVTACSYTHCTLGRRGKGVNFKIIFLEVCLRCLVLVTSRLFVVSNEIGLMLPTTQRFPLESCEPYQTFKNPFYSYSRDFVVSRG